VSFLTVEHAYGQNKLISPDTAYFNSSNGFDQKRCNCVIFRLDDVQDYYEDPGQLKIMDLFLSKNQSLTLGIIMDDIGDDQRVINKIREGLDRGLFELAVHGWDHIDYTKLSNDEQKNSLIRANDKMQLIFGNKSSIFIPPFDLFDQSTINATKKAGFKIMSAGENEEYLFDKYNGTFVSPSSSSNSTINRLPAWTFFKEYDNGIWVKNPLESILGNISDSIQEYGYAVIGFHPSDLMIQMPNGTLVDNVVNPNEIADLSRLIDTIVSYGEQITSFNKVVANQFPSSIEGNESVVKDIPSEMPINTTIVMNKEQCSGGWSVSGYYTPLESDYPPVTSNDNSSNRKISDGTIYNEGFLSDIQTEGWGKTRSDGYLGWYDSEWHRSPTPLVSTGEILSIGSLAVHQGVIPIGAEVRIPSLPSPWDNTLFVVNDDGTPDDRSVDVFTGEGRAAEDETFRITSDNNTICIV
jgi:peptidoglycan/xylan/chitin deacetylase (PgdA/CDA1 family)